MIIKYKIKNRDRQILPWGGDHLSEGLQGSHTPSLGTT